MACQLQAVNVQMHFLVQAFLVMLCVSARGQSPHEGPARRQQSQSVALMRDSVAMQMASVRRQLNTRSTDSFLAAPWFTSNPAQPIAKHEDLAGADDPAGCAKLGPDQAAALIRQAAEEQGLNPGLLHAVIQQESGYRPCVISPKGAMGLMQLMPTTASDFGVVDPMNPRENIAAGSKFLQQLLQRYGGDLVKALSAYNAGPARVDRIGGIPNIVETKQYVNSIMRKLGMLSVESFE